MWQAVEGTLAEAGLELEAAVGPPSWDEEQAPGLRRSAGAFLRQLGWREFGHHLLAAFPHTPAHPLRERFAAVPWREDPAALEAWRRGRTGYPIVDAAMRQLWTTGWMHNRARLLAGSFLVKDLLLPWQEGAAWFWDTLVDADLANNTLGWQWVAGCGADAAPYFRVFNPVTQGRRFDPDGAYVRRWVPELARPARREHLHAPWLAPAGRARGRRRHARRDATRSRSSTTARPACARSPPTTRSAPADVAGRRPAPPARLDRQSSGTISGTGRPSGPSAHQRERARPAEAGLAGRARD